MCHWVWKLSYITEISLIKQKCFLFGIKAHIYKKIQPCFNCNYYYRFLDMSKIIILYLIIFNKDIIFVIILNLKISHMYNSIN